MNTPTLAATSVHPGRQRGAAVIEFALVAMLFFTLLFGAIEMGRLFYAWNSVQEATRRSARLAVVSPVAAGGNACNALQRAGLFGADAMPGVPELGCLNIDIEYLDATANPIPNPPADQVTACMAGAQSAGCVNYVRVSIAGVSYQPLIGGFFPDFNLPLPASTVTMPAESMGYNPAG